MDKPNASNSIFNFFRLLLASFIFSAMSVAHGQPVDNAYVIMFVPDLTDDRLMLLVPLDRTRSFGITQEQP